MNELRLLCGLFGKLPQQPDFISRHLSPEFTDAFHHWLQSALTVTREQLGEGWLDAYLTSPVWCFAIDAGICGAEAAMGVMIPSVDEVGRYYPLALVHVGAHRPWSAYISASDWYHEAERVLLSALEESTRYSDLVDAFESMPTPSCRPLTYFQCAEGEGRACMVALGESSGAAAGMPGLTERAYGRLLGRHSLWWTAGSQRVEPCLLITAEMPEPGQVAAMLDGQWQRWGWAVEEPVAVSVAEVDPT